MAAKKEKKKQKKPEKIPHEEIRTNEHTKYEEEPVIEDKTSYDEEDVEEL